MSKGTDTCLFGVIRPAADSCDERGKSVKSEPELPPELKSQPEQELKSEPKPKSKYEWFSKRVEDLEMSDFSVYDDDIEHFIFKCDRFVYRNKAQKQKNKEIKVARAEYKERCRNLSEFDAIAPPEIAGLLDSIVPLDMDDKLRLKLTPLCEAALAKYNTENQGAKFVLADIVKTTWRPGGMYYTTFQAKEDPSNSIATTFQAQVMRMLPAGAQPKVLSCAVC